MKTFLIILASIITIITLCTLALKAKKLWPKIVILIFAVVLLSLAGFFGTIIKNINASLATNVDAKVVSVQHIDDNNNYKIECEYNYKNKTYRAFVERDFFEEPEVGSTINVKVTTDKPDEINIYRGDESGDGMLLVALVILFCGILLFGGAGVIILIPTIISIIKYCRNKKKSLEN